MHEDLPAPACTEDRAAGPGVPGVRLSLRQQPITRRHYVGSDRIVHARAHQRTAGRVDSGRDSVAEDSVAEEILHTRNRAPRFQDFAGTSRFWF